MIIQQSNPNTQQQPITPLPGLTSKSSFVDNSKTVAWTSPETLQTRIVSKENDVWSFGVVLWEITTSASPYSKEQDIQLLESKIISSGSTLSKQDMYLLFFF